MRTPFVRLLSRRRALRIGRRLVGSVLLGATWMGSATAQQTTGLEITSPAAGSQFSPGDVVTVVVSSPAGLNLRSLFVSGEWAALPVTLPATVTLPVPTTQRLGVGYIDATGVTTDDQIVEARPVRIAVERPDVPIGLTVEGSGLYFKNPGYDLPVRLKATFADGAVLDVTESTRVSYTSSNQLVAIANNGNRVSAVGAGKATITASYAAAPQPLVALVGVTVGAHALSPSPSIVDYGAQALGTSQTRQITLTNTHRYDAMTVRSATTSGAFSAASDCIQASPIPPGGTCVAHVMFTPTAPGQVRGFLQLQTSFSTIAEGVALVGEGLGDPAVVLADLTSATSWLGLKNSDDQGTRFDLMAEFYRGGTLVSSALTRCIVGVTRNPNNALQVTSPFGDFTAVPVASGELLTLRLSTRIGTNPNGTKCPGHNNATGLRFYYDAPNRPSRLGVAFGTSAEADHYLHTSGGADVLNVTAPTNATALYKDSAAVTFNGGNPWRAVGEWQLTVP